MTKARYIQARQIPEVTKLAKSLGKSWSPATPLFFVDAEVASPAVKVWVLNPVVPNNLYWIKSGTEGVASFSQDAVSHDAKDRHATQFYKIVAVYDIIANQVYFKESDYASEPTSPTIDTDREVFIGEIKIQPTGSVEPEIPEISEEKLVPPVTGQSGKLLSNDGENPQWQDPTYADENHNHDSDYSDVNHNHDADYSDVNHNHDSDYADVNHNHDSDYSDINHSHDKKIWFELTGFTPTPVSTSVLAVPSTFQNKIKPGVCGLKYRGGYPAWQASHAYSVGDIIRPTTRNGYHYRCYIAGTSGTSEPSWTTTIGGTHSAGAWFICIREYDYALALAISSSQLTIGGVAFGADIEELYFCYQDNIQVLGPVTLSDGTWGQADTEVLSQYDNNILIDAPDGFLVHERVWAKTVDTGSTKASLQSNNGGHYVFKTTNGVQFSANKTVNHSAVDVDPVYYKLTGLLALRKDVIQPGSNNDTAGAMFTDYFIINE